MTSLAYHGPVRLLSWSESSAQEFKFKLELLDGRNALAHFENVTRRSGKRAGQRYRAVWQSDEGKEIAGPAELWFCGADWSHQSGATLRFTVHPEDVAWVRAQPTLDVDELAPKVYLGLVQLDVDDRPIDPEKAARAQWAEGLTGGPKSKNVARLCQDREFQAFVGVRMNLNRPATLEEADDWVKRMCDIPSKKCLDHDDPKTGLPVWETYEARVHRPFLSWSQSRASHPVDA
jgi:hypothetical protein